MTIAGDSRVRFSELDTQELAEYRPVNRFALAAFILGWISSLSLIHPVLCVFPFAGAILAIAAVRQLGSSENKQSGRSLAIMGLGLSVLFGSWAVARESSRDLHLYGQARQFAEAWFDLLREGKFQEAHQLTVPEENRAAPGVSLDDHYSAASDTAKEITPNSGDRAREMPTMLESMISPNAELTGFYAQPITKRLRELGAKARYEFRANVQVLKSGVNAEEVDLVFVVSDEQSNQFSIKVTLIRNLKPGMAADWRIGRVADPSST